MTWSASDMLASTGAAMPEWYYEEGRQDYERLKIDLGDMEADWVAKLPGRKVSIDLQEYVGPDQYWVTLNIDSLVVRFPSLLDLQGYAERMYG